MRLDADRDRIEALLTILARRVRVPHTLYLAGGASAVLHGWRTSTRAVDLRGEPDSDELLRALADARDQLDLNIELAGPLDSLPALAGWRERSPWIADAGTVVARHIDFRLQVLAKVQRSLGADLADARAILAAGPTTPGELRQAFAEIEPRLFRYPAVSPPRLLERLEALLANG